MKGQMWSGRKSSSSTQRQAAMLQPFHQAPHPSNTRVTVSCVHCFLHWRSCRDMIDGMRMDLVKSRYETYDELYEYCYRVAGTVALMSMPVMGVDPAYKVGR